MQLILGSQLDLSPTVGVVQGRTEGCQNVLMVEHHGGLKDSKCGHL